VIEGHGSNLVQPEDNNANGVSEKAYLLWISWHHVKASYLANAE
jgi:hypothetical protein